MGDIAFKSPQYASHQFVPKEIWDLEFARVHAIPSSTRQEPAKALTLFSELLNLDDTKSILDAGCGNGRNSIYLAKRGCRVTALDFSDVALQETRHRIATEKLEDRIDVLNHQLNRELPFSEGMFDVTLDCYTSCHFLDMNVFNLFWQEMHRVTRSGGTAISILFPPDDGYYAEMRSDSKIICDSANGVSKRLYTADELRERLSVKFRIQYFARFEFSDIVLGKPYLRAVLICVMKKL